MATDHPADDFSEVSAAVAKTVADTDAAPTDRKRQLLALLVSIEAVALVVLGIVFLAELGRGNHDTTDGPLIFLGVLAATVGLGFGYVAFGLLRGRSWARGPALTWQIVSLPIGGRLVEFGAKNHNGIDLAIAVPVLVIAVTVLVLLISSSRPASGPTSHEPA